MLKTLIKFLLSLYILLWSGYGEMFGQAQQKTVCYSSIRELRKSEDYYVMAMQRNTSVLASSSSTPREKKLKVVESDMELEEDGPTPSKKGFAISNYFTTQFDTRAYDYFFLNSKRRLVSFDDFSSHSLHRSLHLIFQVFKM